MKITKKQLRSIIKESSSDDWENRRNRWAKFKHHMAREPQLYLDWVEKNGHVTASSSSVMATYFLEMRLENEHKIHKKLASKIGLDHEDVMRDLKIQREERSINMGESRTRITKKRLRSIIREMHPRADVDDAYVADLERQEDELATQIRHASKDVYGRKDVYDLEGKSIEELEDLLHDLDNSPEQTAIDDMYRDEEEDRMGRDYDLSPAELAPTRQSMARRPAGSKAVRRMENVNKIKKIIREVLRND